MVCHWLRPYTAPDCKAIHQIQLQWLIVCVNLTGPQDAPIAGYSLFMFVCEGWCPWWVDWVSRWSSPMWWPSPNPPRAWIQQNTGGGLNSDRLYELRHHSSSALGSPSCQAFRSEQKYIPSAPWLLGLGTKPTGFSESPTRRWQIIGLLCLHNHVRRYLIINVIYLILLTFLSLKNLDWYTDAISIFRIAKRFLLLNTSL